MKPILSGILAVTLLSAALFAADKSTKKPRFGPGDKVEVDFGGVTEATVVEIARTGWIKVKFEKNGIEMSPTLPPDQVRLLAKKGEKVKGSGDKKAPGGSKMRTWTDKTGKFKVKAKFVELKDGDVILETDEGKSVTLALDKLSKDDQKVAEDLAKESDDNPFKSSDENPFESGSSKSTAGSKDNDSKDNGSKDDDGDNDVTEVDWSGVETLTPNQTDRWSLTPDKGPEFEKTVSSKPVILASTLKKGGGGAQLNFFERVDGLLFDRTKGQAYAVIHDTPPGKPHSTGIQRIDLVSGKAQDAMELASKMKPVDIDPAGSLILSRTEHMFEQRATPGLSVWKIGEKGIKHVRSWSPVEPGDFHKSAASFAQFVDSDHALTVAFPGKLVMWQLSKLKAVYKMEIAGNSKPALSAGRKYMAASAKNGAFVFDAASGETLGKLPGDPGLVTGMSFSPDGKYLAALSPQRLLVWDLEKGEVYRDIYFSHQVPATDMDWVGGKGYVLLGGERLVDLDKRIVLWQYQHEAGQHLSRGYGEMGGFFWYALTSPDRKQRGLFHVKLPHDDALSKAESLNADELLAVRPGATVSLSVNVQGAPAEQQQVYTALVEQLQKLGIKVANNAPLALQASTEAGKTQDITYRKFGLRGNETAKVTEQIARLKYVENGKLLWESVSVGGAPMMLQMKQGQSLQDALAQYQKPNLQFFTTVKLPQYVARPGEALAYGASSLSAQGIQNVPLKAAAQPGVAGR